MDAAALTEFLDGMWEREIIPTLTDYIRIPNKSPAFDADWQAHGHMDRAVALFEGWARAHLSGLPGATVEVVRLDQRTPLILIEIPGRAAGVSAKPTATAQESTVLMYGHLDKQPEMVGWSQGLGPWEPVRRKENDRSDRLYGRGGVDDGYAMFAGLCALLALKQQDIAHARIVMLIEASEESGSPDLPAYIEHLGPRIGTPGLVICLDSGCGNYDQLWLTTSLRGILVGNLKVRVLTEGVHSGDASGVVPSSFRIARHVLSRVEDEGTGTIKLAELFAPVPADRAAQARGTAQILQDDIWRKLPFAGATRPMADDNTELLLNRAWRPQLAITGMDGYPLPEDAGSVLLPQSTMTLSMRLPPTCPPQRAEAALKKVLEENPPYGAEVAFDIQGSAAGWNAPALAPWLEAALDKASRAAFGKGVAFQGEGGSIPFMAMLGRKFPATQFVVTGLLGPQSNAHGPNEFLHIPAAKKLTACIASILADHALQG